MHFKSLSDFIVYKMIIVLPLIKMILIKTRFDHFISLNIMIPLCLQFANLQSGAKYLRLTLVFV